MLTRGQAASFAVAGAAFFCEAADAEEGKAGRGAQVVFTPSPEARQGWPRRCSTRHRMCARIAPGTSRQTADAALAAADRAWDAIVDTLGAPPPEGFAGEPWLIDVVEGAIEGGGRAVLDGRDPRSRSDRAFSHALVSRELAPGCTLEVALARVVARGSLLRAAPATDEGTAAAEAEALGRLAAPCASPSANDDERAFQSLPERALVDPAASPVGRGAADFFEFLSGYGAPPGALVVSTWALAATYTQAGDFASERWTGSPTSFDVLRASLSTPSNPEAAFEERLSSFSIARASFAFAPRPAWDIPWPERPRRLVAPVPVSPTGASYVRIARPVTRQGAKLRVEAEWEDYGRLRWTVLKFGVDGRVAARVSLTSPENATRAAMTIELLDDVDHLAIVAANVGSTEHSFDPNQEWWEPHGWLLTVEGE